MQQSSKLTDRCDRHNLGHPPSGFALCTDHMASIGTPVGSVREEQSQARLVNVNEGDGQTKRPKIAARYLDFQSSGWSVQVPASGDVTLNVASK